MRSRQDDRPETCHLACPVCTALPGTSCIDEDYQELAGVHPSRKLSVAERNRRSAADWVPPELAERHRKAREEAIARAPLFNPRLSPGVTATLAGHRPPTTPAPRHGTRGTRQEARSAPARPADSGGTEAGAGTVG